MQDKTIIINKLEKYNEYINGVWKKYMSTIFFPKSNKHIFIRDMAIVETTKTKYEKKPLINKNIGPIDFNINEYFKKGKCKFIPKKVLPNKIVNEIFSDFMKYNQIPRWDKLKKQLDNMSNYLLYSNINPESIKNMFVNKKSDTINILILGAGPTGLYIANYLYTINLLSPRINLLIIDNKTPVNRESFRLPYTRNRIYGLHLELLNSFFPMFPCIKELTKKGGIQIKYLENIMIIFIYGYGIPIYFTNQINNEDSLKKFISQNKIDIVFDCTGNRFKNNFIVNPSENIISTFFPKDTIFENDKYLIAYHNNEYQLQWKNNIDNRFYISMEIYNNNGKYLDMPIWANEIVFTHDVKFFSKFHNICIKMKPNKINKIMKLFDGLEDMTLSKRIQEKLIYYSDKNIKFSIIEPKLYQKILISSIIHQSDQNTIYIGAGDTIFSSHFAIGAGLNRLLRFINRIVWYIQTLSEI